MRWHRNPFLGALVALAALGFYARAQTPMAALAIGLPFALVIWVYWCFGHQMAASKGVMATPPAHLLTNAAGILILLLMGAWFVYMCYGLVTGKGVIGWLNAVQAARDGQFSTKLSFIVALFDLLCAMGVFALAAMWLGRGRTPAPGPAAVPLRPGAAPVRPAAAPPRDPIRVVLWMLAALAVAPWLLGYPVHLWSAAEHREDAQAHYVHVALGAPEPAWPQQPHVALDGELRGDQVLVLKEGNHARKTYFVPMTGAGWTPAQPVNAVLTFVAEAPPRLSRPILGRLRSDALPLAAIDAFARSGVSIAPTHRLVELVPSEQGQVPDRSQEDRRDFLLIATVISAISLLVAPVFWLVSKFKRRRTRPA